MINIDGRFNDAHIQIDILSKPGVVLHRQGKIKLFFLIRIPVQLIGAIAVVFLVVGVLYSIQSVQFFSSERVVVQRF